MRKLQILFFLVLLCNWSFAQESKMEKVPKLKSFELGYRYVLSSSFDAQPSSGTTLLFDYAWQLSGFSENKNAAYISVPLGYTYLMNSNDTLSKNTRILSYGWTVRHDLGRNKKAIPFMGYALLLNQLKLDNVKGGVMGHQTKFDFGYDFMTSGKLRYFFKLEYSYTRYPKLGEKESQTIHAAELKIGLRF